MPNDNPNDSWHYPTSRAGKLWVNGWRKIYHPLGFKKGYNFPLFIIMVGALMGFVLSRLQYLNFDGIFLKSTIPGDAVHYLHGHLRIGMIIHLATILPAGFLACFQFVPIIRYKALLFHRLNGYAVILLFLVSNAGAYMIVPVAAGASASTQVGIGVLATSTTITISLSYYNIKRLQIDQHRAWMIRTWVYAGSIVSLRLIATAANKYMSIHQGHFWYDVQSCRNIWQQYTLYGAPAGQGNPTPMLYPQCTSANSSVGVAVPADMSGKGPEFTTAVFHVNFGMSLWLAMVIHAFGVELYLKLTPAEAERLRIVSYEKQVKAGLRNPGRSGLTVDRFGDAPTWRPVDPVEMNENGGK